MSNTQHDESAAAPQAETKTEGQLDVELCDQGGQSANDVARALSPLLLSIARKRIIQAKQANHDP